MVSFGEEYNASSLLVTTPPAKQVYQSGENFDATGMVVKAVLDNGTQKEVSGYTVSPKILTNGVNSVTVSFGDLSIAVPVTVEGNEKYTTVTEATKLAVGKTATVEALVVGVAHEGKNNDTELIIKDLSNDNLMAVRDIPYGIFPDFGYEKGDRIVFDATVKKDTSSSTCYSLKKYLSFSKDNGAIDNTIVSKGNKINYKFDNVTVLNSQEDMKKAFAGDGPALYSYFKITADSYINYYEASDTILYRLHKNPEATKTTEASISNDYNTSVPLALRDDVMVANLGVDWSDLFFDEVVSGFPGMTVDKDFYLVYTGGNRVNLQFAILEEDWVCENNYEIIKLSDDKKSVYVNIKVPGNYTVMFIDYTDKKLANIDTVSVTVAENETGTKTVDLIKSFELGVGDKVMLWDNFIGMNPKCKAFEIK